MNKRKLGQDFEDIACKYLIDLGYSIEERNFHAGKIGEIDIIAKFNDIIYFVEVKGRSSLRFGTPAESISASKLRKIRLTSSFYLNQKQLNQFETRFWVVEILQQDTAYSINVIEDIFS